LVVGAGPQGLAFALGLALKGEPVVLVERASVVGGQARSFRYGKFVFDFGLHAFVSYDPRLVSFMRRVLKEDFRRFRPRAATLLANGAFVEDCSAWRVDDEVRKLHDVLPSGTDSWNCMRISEPPPIIYPRRGGFGTLCERLAEMFTASGGLLLLDSSVNAGDLETKDGRLVSARLAGRRTAIRGCYWSAGSYLLSAPSSAEKAASRGGTLALFHFMLKGRAPQPYHWVRVDAKSNPLLPRLVYYPTRFSPRTAPNGHYGVGAVVAVPPAEGLSPDVSGLMGWFAADPGAFRPLVQETLDKAGLLRAADLVDVRIERLPTPPARIERRARHPFEGVSNFWDSDRWLQDDPRESGVPLQMTAAMRALEEVAA
jgi:phytoene dehydrogenase-like protein